jgi:hypothetical protein
MIDEATRQLLVVGLEEPDWMGEPELRWVMVFSG